MHVETVTLDRVFDVQRRNASKYAPKRTDFSFESAGTRHFAVQVPGWPGLAQGDRLTAVLQEPGNWQTLAGWKNHTTGELVLPDTRRSLWGVFRALAGGLVGYGLFAGATTPAGRTASAMFAVLCGILGSVLVEQWLRERAQSRFIRHAECTQETRQRRP